MKKERPSFLKKRSKKLLPLASASGEPRTSRQAFFGSFFQERTSFFSRKTAP
jgi:hypothetical protein